MISIRIKHLENGKRIFVMEYDKPYRLHIQGKDYKGARRATISARLNKDDSISLRAKLPYDYRGDNMFRARREWVRRGKPDAFEIENIS